MPLRRQVAAAAVLVMPANDDLTNYTLPPASHQQHSRVMDRVLIAVSLDTHCPGNLLDTHTLRLLVRPICWLVLLLVLVLLLLVPAVLLMIWPTVLLVVPVTVLPVIWLAILPVVLIRPMV